MRWFMDLLYPVWRRTRSDRAFEATREPAVDSSFDSIREGQHALVITYRRSGEPVPTPVNAAVSDEGRLYFRSEPHVAKIRRIRSNPRVRVAPCSIRGVPLGPPVEGIARILPEAESDLAYRLLSSQWRADIAAAERLFDRLGVPAVYVEVEPAAAPPGSEP